MPVLALENAFENNKLFAWHNAHNDDADDDFPPDLLRTAAAAAACVNGLVDSSSAVEFCVFGLCIIIDSRSERFVWTDTGRRTNTHWLINGFVKSVRIRTARGGTNTLCPINQDQWAASVLCEICPGNARLIHDHALQRMHACHQFEESMHAFSLEALAKITTMLERRTIYDLSTCVEAKG